MKKCSQKDGHLSGSRYQTLNDKIKSWQRILYPILLPGARKDLNMLRMIVKAAGAVIGFSGFLAVWFGCELFSLCVDTRGAAFVAVGLIGVVIGATMADAWYF